MKSFREYWTFLSIRGALTILASICVVAIPFATSAIMSLPILAVLTINVVATYLAIDAATTILLRFELPVTARHRNLLYTKTALNLVTAATLYLIVYGALPVSFAAWIVAENALLTACLEWYLARDTNRLYRDPACFALFGAALLGGMAFPFTTGLNAGDLSFALAGWVGLYGAAQVALGGRMLFVEYRAEHPAAAFDYSWREAMDVVRTPVAVSIPDCGTCAACPAEVLCKDDSVRGQIASVMASREPLIVRASQISRVLENARA
jgi:hypothetical protein